MNQCYQLARSTGAVIDILDTCDNLSLAAYPLHLWIRSANNGGAARLFVAPAFWVRWSAVCKEEALAFFALESDKNALRSALTLTPIADDVLLSDDPAFAPGWARFRAHAAPV